jgi:hypothetical protein
MDQWELDFKRNIDEIELENDLELESIYNLDLTKKDNNFNNLEKQKDLKDFKCLKKYLEDELKPYKFHNNKCTINNVDAVSGAYLRIEIPHNCDPNTILQKYANVEIDYKIGGNTINKAPLKVCYYLCEKFGRNIEVLNANILSNEKPKTTIYKKKHFQINKRFNFENLNGRYLDIPIIFEDFCYAHIESIISNKCNVIQYYLIGDELKESCYIVYNNIIMYEYETRKKMMNIWTEKIINTIYFKQIVKSENLNINIGNKAKFLFLFMEKNQDSYINFPEITSFTVKTTSKTIYYDIYNLLFEDYENYRIYGVSFDPNITMKKWMDFKKEQNEDDDYYPSKNNKLTFKVLSNIENVNIKFSPYVGNFNMSILVIHQNILMNRYGMTNNGYKYY